MYRDLKLQTDSRTDRQKEAQTEEQTNYLLLVYKDNLYLNAINNPIEPKFSQISFVMYISILVLINAFRKIYDN